MDLENPNTIKQNIFMAALPQPHECSELSKHIALNKEHIHIDYNIVWAPPPDLHITLGYIKEVEQQDIKAISDAFAIVEDFKTLQATVVGVQMYENAITLSLQPEKILLKMHKKISRALDEEVDSDYQVCNSHKFSPHITIGRVLLPRRHHLKRKQTDALEHWARTTFKDYTFEISQAALMCRNQATDNNYERIRIYPLKC